MMFEELRHLKSDKKTLREFGLVVGGVFAAIGLFLWWRGVGVYGVLLGLGLVLIAPAVVFPRVLGPVYKGWMTLALMLGWVMTRVILAIVFFGVLTPIAFLMRVFRQPTLDLKYPDGAESFWVKRPGKRSRKSYEKQY